MARISDLSWSRTFILVRSTTASRFSCSTYHTCKEDVRCAVHKPVQEAVVWHRAREGTKRAQHRQQRPPTNAPGPPAIQCEGPIPPTCTRVSLSLGSSETGKADCACAFALLVTGGLLGVSMLRALALGILCSSWILLADMLALSRVSKLTPPVSGLPALLTFLPSLPPGGTANEVVCRRLLLREPAPFRPPGRPGSVGLGLR